MAGIAGSVESNIKNDKRAQKNKADKRAQKKNRAIRLIVMVAVLVTSTVIGLIHQFVKGATVVGVDALCPFGGIESAYNLIMTGMTLRRIALSSFILLAGVLIAAVLFRRSFCGTICPMGTVQELFARLGKKLIGRRIAMPEAIDRPLRYMKYIVLALTILFTIQAAELVIRPYDPWVAYHHLASAELFTEFLIGFIVLVVTAFGSLIYDRFFCKYACPMGAFLGLISKLSVFKMRRNEETCISCNACDKVCPVNIKVSEQRVVDSAECIDCAECINVCPNSDTLAFSTGGGLKMQPLKVLGSVAAIFILVIGMTTISGSFEWKTKSLAQQMNESGGYDFSQIKGRMTIHEISEATGISGHEFREEFKLSESDMGEQIKTLEDKYGVSAEDVREFVDERIGKNGDAKDNIGADSLSVESENKNDDLSDGEKDKAVDGVVGYDSSSIKGMMSLIEVAEESKVPLKELQKQFNVTDGDLEKRLRDIKDAYGFEVYEVRDFVEDYLKE